MNEIKHATGTFPPAGLDTSGAIFDLTIRPSQGPYASPNFVPQLWAATSIAMLPLQHTEDSDPVDRPVMSPDTAPSPKELP